MSIRFKDDLGVWRAWTQFEDWNEDDGYYYCYKYTDLFYIGVRIGDQMITDMGRYVAGNKIEHLIYQLLRLSFQPLQPAFR